jgi:hypothetical protein
VDFFGSLKMNKQPHVGLSLVNYAPVGMVLTAVIAGSANTVLSLNITTLIYAVLGGIACAGLLLGYWLAKGGTFFVLGVSVPLLLVLFAPLVSIFALINLVSGFFFGFFSGLLVYTLYKGYKKT